MNKSQNIFFIISFSLLIISCNDFQKLLNSDDLSSKYRGAESYYNEGDYNRANRLLEQIIPSYRGKPQAERVLFFFANSYFRTKRYFLAAYQFENFIKSYPKSQKIEEAYFLEAKSYYHLSPDYSLDQDETRTALEKLQIFINNYPQSEFLVESNILVDELETKLEKKNFEISKQYYTIRDYKAAIKSLDNFIADFPGTPYREGAMYYKFLSAYEVGVNSVINKQKERLEDLVILYNNIFRYYPETVYADDLNDKLDEVNNILELYK